ncbi:ribonuclease P protein component, partial [Pseudomonas sp. GW460-R15]
DFATMLDDLRIAFTKPPRQVKGRGPKPEPRPAPAASRKPD